MQLLFNLLSLVLIVCCCFLGLLILIQLPKKEAGLGQAFGGATTEALFGAGSGNTLTNLTKYSAGTFIVLCVFLAWLSSYNAQSLNKGVLRELSTLPAGNAAGLGRIPTNALAPAATAVTNIANAASTVVTNLSAPIPQSPAAPAPKK